MSRPHININNATTVISAMEIVRNKDGNVHQSFYVQHENSIPMSENIFWNFNRHYHQYSKNCKRLFILIRKTKPLVNVHVNKKIPTEAPGSYIINIYKARRKSKLRISDLKIAWVTIRYAVMSARKKIWAINSEDRKSCGSFWESWRGKEDASTMDDVQAKLFLNSTK